MPFFKKIILGVISVLTGFACVSQPAIPDSFIETPAPKVSTNEWSSLNSSRNEYGVCNENGKLKVSKVKEINTYELILPHGKLVGVNHGEWGGSLTFFPADTTLPKKEIKKGNVMSIFNFNNDIYFMEGLAHGVISRGALYKLRVKNQKFNYSKLLDFEDAPEAYTIFGNKILIAANESFFIVQNFKKKQVIKEAFWFALYPNSIAAFDDENIIIGMRGGIVKLNLLTNKYIFYKPGK